MDQHVMAIRLVMSVMYTTSAYVYLMGLRFGGWGLGFGVWGVGFWVGV